MNISSQVQRIKGHTLGKPEKAFIITESERDPKEVRHIILCGLALSPGSPIFSLLHKKRGEPGTQNDMNVIYNERRQLKPQDFKYKKVTKNSRKVVH